MKSAAQKYDRNMRPHLGHCKGLVWRDPKRVPFQVAGLAWFAKERAWRRMPKRPKWKLPEAVDGLANHTAGAQVRFRTDARRVAVKVRLPGPPGMVHMATTGIAGVDCYVNDGKTPRYYGTTKFDPKLPRYEILLFEHAERRTRDFTLYLPLYSGVKDLQIGLERGARLGKPRAWRLPKPVVVYGTSITQGGCASRPGSAFTNILSRRMNLEFVNLGFSGSGRGEPEVARVIASIRSASLFVLDYEANTGNGAGLFATMPEFIRILRAKHPRTPILVLSRVRIGREWLQNEPRQKRAVNLRFQHDLVKKLRATGDKHIHFYPGTDLLGVRDWEECTVDGSHPTDLGFYRMADALEPVARRILFGSAL